MKRRGWIIVGVVVLAIAGYFLWKWLNPPPVVDPYKTAAITRGDLVEQITANGVINPVRVVSVGTQVSGTVKALYADFNDRVTAGQVLLRLDPALFTSRLQASEASLANVRANAALQAANARRAEQLVKQDYISKQDFETSQADIARVKPGQQVDFTVDAYGARKFHGTVDQIRLNPTTQQNVVNYTVIVKAANPDGALLPGMTANASFIVSDRKNVLLIPNAALSFKPEGFKPQRGGPGRAAQPDMVTVFAEVAGKAEPRRVHVGASDSDNTEVVAGPLKEGDIVITGSNITTKKSGGMFSGPPGGRRESANGGRGDSSNNKPSSKARSAE
jgi:multidrug efflux pump subunit AcrA (membrane-fusion protein)